MLWFRVDNRLVHGQVIEGWLPYVAARHLIVANDAMSADLLQQQIVSLAVPEQVAIHFVPVDALLETLACCGESSLVLFADCQDARRALESGVDIRALNIGNLHYAPGKIQVFPHVALSEQDSVVCDAPCSLILYFWGYLIKLLRIFHCQCWL